MATRIIKINGLNADGTAQMDNNGNLTCDPGDIIQWNIQPNSGVASIAIVYTGDSQIFSQGPAQVGNSNNWQGTVSDGAGGEDEEYTCSATASATGKTVPFDPKITVNPKNK